MTKENIFTLIIGIFIGLIIPFLLCDLKIIFIYCFPNSINYAKWDYDDLDYSCPKCHQHMYKCRLEDETKIQIICKECGWESKPWNTKDDAIHG